MSQCVQLRQSELKVGGQAEWIQARRKSLAYLIGSIIMAPPNASSSCWQTALTPEITNRRGKKYFPFMPWKVLIKDYIES
jgi:hypothetical protein